MSELTDWGLKINSETKQDTLHEVLQHFDRKAEEIQTLNNDHLQKCIDQAIQDNMVILPEVAVAETQTAPVVLSSERSQIDETVNSGGAQTKSDGS